MSSWSGYPCWQWRGQWSLTDAFRLSLAGRVLGDEHLFLWYILPQMVRLRRPHLHAATSSVPIVSGYKCMYGRLSDPDHGRQSIVIDPIVLYRYRYAVPTECVVVGGELRDVAKASQSSFYRCLLTARSSFDTCLETMQPTAAPFSRQQTQ